MTQEILFIDFNSILILIWLMFLIPFVAYIITHTAKFFPTFISQVVRKYKDKRTVNINYNFDYNRDYNARILKHVTTPFKDVNKKKEIKKNHGKRIY